MVEFLLSPPGQRLLAVADEAYDGANALAVSTRLRADHDPFQVAAALTQVELRRRAVDKFGTDAALLYFTPSGLEQATHGLVAAHRANRASAAGWVSVLDLGCGIGADLVAFARAGLDVTGVEQDPTTATMARANLSALGLEGGVVVADATRYPRDGGRPVFADPARRGATGRVFDPAAYSPSWGFVRELLSATAVVKVAPGIPHALVPAGVEAEWVSVDGQLKEAALWSGASAGCLRRATVLSTASPAATMTEADDPGTAAVRAVGRYVYEPDDAVVRAHLVTAVAAAVSGWLVDDHLAYVSSDALAVSRFARAYAVLEVLPFREKQLRAALRVRDIGSLTIKKRGVTVTPEALRERLGLTGSRPGTVILTRTPASAKALLVEPVG